MENRCIQISLESAKKLWKELNDLTVMSRCGRKFIDTKGNCTVYTMLLEYKNKELLDITGHDLLFMPSDKKNN